MFEKTSASLLPIPSLLPLPTSPPSSPSLLPLSSLLPFLPSGKVQIEDTHILYLVKSFLSANQPRRRGNCTGCCRKKVYFSNSLLQPIPRLLVVGACCKKSSKCNTKCTVNSYFGLPLSGNQLQPCNGKGGVKNANFFKAK